MFKRLYVEADADDRETVEHFKNFMMTQAFELAKEKGLVIDAKLLEETSERFHVTVEQIIGGYRLVMDIDLS